VMHESGQLMGISACAVDTGGHHAHDVYNYCRQRESQRVYAIKGDGADGKPIKGKSSLVDVNFEGRVLASGVRLWFIGSNQTKDLLANRLRLQLPGPGFVHFPDGLNKDFFDQLTAEERRKVITPRGTVWRWKKVVESRRNEILDLMQMCIFAAYTLDVHKYTDVDWQRLELVVQPLQRDMLNEAAEDEKAPITADLPGTIGDLDWKRGAGRG
jgi:terminase, large subunit